MPNNMSRNRKSIDQNLIRELAKLLKETELSEIEIEQNDLRIRVVRTASGGAQTPGVPVMDSGLISDSTAKSTLKTGSVSHEAIPSPMVGTVYLAPAPGAKRFVSIREMIREGQTVMIVEAMKTMNQISAPRSGIVTAILVDDGQPVEFGEPLFTIE